MAYNVFKRPMFKRGGSTTGTGIMSHVESKKIGGGTISGNNMSNNRTGFQAPILTIGEGMASEMARGKPGFSSTPFSQYSSPIGPTRTGFQKALTRFPRALPLGLYGAAAGVGTGIGGLLDFYAKSTYTPEQYRRLKEMSGPGFTFDETNLDVGEALDYIKAGGEIGEAPGFFPRGGKRRYFESKGLDPETGLPIPDTDMRGDPEANLDLKEGKSIVDDIDVPEIKEKPTEEKEQPKTFEDTYETEKKRIEKLIGDDDNKGMVAIALSEAIKTPGTIADKAGVLNSQLLKIMAGKKKDKRDIAKLAYTATKEIEKAKIVAGKQGYTERLANEARQYQTTLRDPNASEADKNYARNQLDIIKSTIGVVGADKGTSFAGLNQAANAINELSKLAKKIGNYEQGSDKYNELLGQYMASRELLLGQKNEGLNRSIAQVDEILRGSVKSKGLKEGGRVNRAMGTPESGETPTAPVQKLSFAELRNRLPKEITDDVIRLISSSEEALQDFAYIRTQGDVNKFNMKYGVNAVLPAQA
jgi:hypothetical protein